MNSTLQKALTASLLTLGMAGSVLAQYNYDGHCIDPNNTAPYSNPFIAYQQFTPLWHAGIGVVGTVTYNLPKALGPCWFIAPGNFSGAVPVTGRPSFSIGKEGTIQDDQLGISPRDNFLRLSIATNSFGATDGFSDDDPGGLPWDFSTGSGSGFSFARLYVQSNTGAITSTLYGSSAMKLAFMGASNRYMYTESVNGTVDIRCVIDVLGDCSRVSWQLTNNGPAAQGLGLWYGEIPGFVDENYGPVLPPYITLPGRKPITTDRRFTRVTDPIGFPAYANFTEGQQSGYGLEVVNEPIPAVSDENGASDQTPVDEFVIGDAVFVLSGFGGAVTNPTFGDFTFPDATLGDGAFIQKWQPVPVASGSQRTIITYYRSVTGDSNYANGYSAVVDTPKAIALNPADTTSFDKNPFTIRVWIDNTGGFGIVDKTLPLTNVQVTLNLPQGLSSPGNPAQHTLTQFINVVNPVEMTPLDFQVQADPTLFGFIPYTVTITPTPGAQKIVSGIINFETTPLLLLRPGANLVTAAWTFSSPDWQTVLAPLQPDLDYQAFTWDPVQQQYIIQTSAERGKGTWLDVNQDLGFLPLSGNPVPPSDMFPGGSAIINPLVQLHQGWNLVGNPYTYSIPLGELVGAVNGTSVALTYTDMVTQGLIDGSFAYYDQDLQSYLFLQSAADEMLPNHGYWVFANQDFVLSFPFVYDLFVRSHTPTQPFRQNFKQWRFQIAAKAQSVAELATYAGFARDPMVAQAYRARRSPISPAASAIRAYITEPGSTPLAESVKEAAVPPRGVASTQYAEILHAAYGKQNYNYNVFSKKAGPITLTWPNLAQIPTNLAVRVTDSVTHQTIDPRREAGYSYSAPENSLRTFQVQITPLGTVRQTIADVGYSIKPAGSIRQMTIAYQLASRGAVTMQVYQNGVHVGTIVNDKDVLNGPNQIVWSMLLSNGQTAKSGSYTLQISATGEGGDTATRLVRLTIP